MQSAKNAMSSGKNYVEKMVHGDNSSQTGNKLPLGQKEHPSRNIANQQSQLENNQGYNTSQGTTRSSHPESTAETRNRPSAGTVREETTVSKEHTDFVRDQPGGKPAYNDVRNRVNPNVTTRDTQVEEIVNPAVVKEKIRPTEKERTDVEFQRELHQDHYQTRVQPVVDREVLPEEHVHRTLPTEYRERRAGNKDEVDNLLNKERQEFKDSRTVLPGDKRTEEGRVVAEESRHHHVHEIVQPILEREVIQPTVVHTTQPIHERIEKDATFHPKTVQPTMTLEEFQAAGGTLDGRSTISKEVFQGEPQVHRNGGADVKHPSAHNRTAGNATSTAERTDKPESYREANESVPGSYPNEQSSTTRSGVKNPSTSSNQTSSTKKPGMANRIGSGIESTGNTIANMGRKME